MTRHTRGPWNTEWRSGHARGMREVITAEGVDRIAVVSRAGVRTAVESEANADLIAAAPDLLEACEKAMEWAAGYPLGGEMDRVAADDVYEACDVAIAKAKGEQ